MWYADLLVSMGHQKEAIAEAQRAQELDPLSPNANTWLGQIAFLSRDYTMASQCFRKALDLDANYAEAHAQLGDTYVEGASYKEGEAEFQKALDISGKDPRYLAYLGRGYAASGKRVEAFRALGELKRLRNPRLVQPYNIALIYAALGERDQAFEWLQRSTADGPSALGYLKVDPRLDSLRSDPRFQDLLRRLGFPP